MSTYERLQRLARDLYLPAGNGRLSAHEALQLNDATNDLLALVQEIRDDYGLDG